MRRLHRSGRRAKLSGGADPVLAPLTGTVRVRLRADAYNASTGTCTDTSGEGNHATQGTADNRPTLGTANGRAAMVFDGTNDRLVTANFAGGACAQPTTIFAVANLSTPGANRVIVDGNDITNRSGIWWKIAGVWGMFTTADVFCVGGNAAVSTVSAFACTFNGASSIGLFDDWDTDIMTGNPGSAVLDGLTIGAGFNGTAPWIGPINEVIVVEDATAGDVLAVRDYFRKYYSLDFLA